MEPGMGRPAVTTDATIRIPPSSPPSPVCPRCGGTFEQSVRLDDGKILRGHVPGGRTCNPKEPLRDGRERRRAFAKR